MPWLAPDDWSTRELMHRMGHGSMRAALAYQAVVGWIDMVLTIAGWPLELRLRDWTRTTAGRIKRPSRCAACGRSRATQLPRLLDPTLTSAASRVIAGIDSLCGMRTRINKATRSQRTANGLQALISEMNAC